MSRAVIFGLEGTALTQNEAAFFRDAGPWGFILFARNISDPDQVRRLTADLRETVGRDAPILIDQEGGRVARMGPPHWRRWAPVFSLFDGADEQSALEAAQLRYQIIACELRDVGIDVNCAPLLDVPVQSAHDIIGARALGNAAEDVARRGRTICEALLSGGVLPVIKHIPGHGRATVDSHHELPRVDTSLEDLHRSDFAAFAALSDQTLGMTAHVVFEALDSDACATLSPKVISIIRGAIGFDGLLMTDDLSMKALDGSMASRVQGALGAGCDIILHCNGEAAEMEAIAAEAPALSGIAGRRADAALTARKSPSDIDLADADRRYQALTGESVYG